MDNDAQAHLKELEKIYDGLDLNHDGFVNRTELQQLCQEMGSGLGVGCTNEELN